MSGFAILCTTCQARLMVRNRKAIGEILACPKCGSMVLVESPPLDSDAPDSSAVAETAPPPAPAGHLSSQDTVDAPFESGAFEAPDAPPPEALEEAEAPSAHAAGADAANADDRDTPARDEHSTLTSPLLPDAEWVSREAQQLRKWLLIGAGMVTGVLGAVAVAGFLVAQQERGHEVVREETAPTDAGDSGPSRDASTGDAQDPADPQSVTPPTSPREPLPEDPQREDPQPKDPQPKDPRPKDPQPGDPAAGGPQPGDPDPQPGNLQPGNLQPGEPQPGDPLGGEPPALPRTPDAVGPADPPGLKPRDNLQGDSISETLKEFETILNGTAPQRALLPPGPDDPFVESDYERLLAEVAPARRPNPRRVDAAKRLADPCGLQASGTPLIELTRMLTSITTVPITLDAESLLRAGVAPGAKVTLSLALPEATAGRALDEAARQLGLQALVGASDARLQLLDGEKRLSVSLPADDLAADAESRQRLLDLIQEVITPGAWAPGGAFKISWEGPRLVVQHRKDALHDVLTLLEKMRVARRLPLRSDLPPERFALASRRARAVPALSRPLSVNFRQPTPIDEVLRRLTELTQVQLLVDWAAVADEGWNPDAEVSLLADQDPFGKALRQLVAPMNLDYYVADGDLIVLTTRAALAQQMDIELYPAGDLIDPQADVPAILAMVRRAAGLPPAAPPAAAPLAAAPPAAAPPAAAIVPPGALGGGPPPAAGPANGPTIVYDSGSQCFVARLPQAQQRRLQQFLDQFRQR